MKPFGVETGGGELGRKGTYRNGWSSWKEGGREEVKVDLRDKLFCTRGEMRKMERKRSVICKERTRSNGSVG